MAHTPLKILLVSSEAVPFAKTGGLADVVGALPQELIRLGHEVRLVIPRYGSIDGAAHGFQEWLRLDVPTALGTVSASIERGMMNGVVPVLAVRHDPFFARAGLYGEGGRDYADNLDRFAFFCRAVMELLPRLAAEAGWTPDILHGHDWQTALCMVYPRSLYAGAAAMQTLGTVFTIHNIGYQGHFHVAEFPKTGLSWSLFTPAWLEFYGLVNLLKGGLLFADYLTTVSPTYSREIQTPAFGFGLDGVIKDRADRLVGIVNGIDTDLWNPETDPYLPSRYAAGNLAGKAVCKMSLQQEMNLPLRHVPLLVVVSRLSDQKGLDLVADVLPELLAEDVQFVLLGAGDPPIEARFRTLHALWPEKFGLRLGFDEGLAHRIQAGGDIFLMPSRYEPCGLSQLYSLRYGTVPVVRKTGGLADTVVPEGAGEEEPATGFMFEADSAAALLAATGQALAAYAQPARWAALMQAGMASDVSWARSARAYADLYAEVVKLRAGGV